MAPASKARLQLLATAALFSTGGAAIKASTLDGWQVACLRAGVNDLGGTLMHESISRAAGASHGQEMAPTSMEELIHSVGRTPRVRTTLYAPSTRMPTLSRNVL